MDEVRFTISGEPKSKGRPRFSTKTGHAYTPKETAMYENLVKISYQQASNTKFNGEVEALIVGYFPIPKSESKKRKAKMLSGEILHTKKIDCDNLAKTILDSLNGIAYDDDKQVCRLLVEKRYGEQSRVEVTLKEVQH